jgi:hypothetical protein
MNNQLLFDFIVDKTAKTVTVNKEFNAELSLVWDAFTKQEILDQWWAPKPWESRTKFMNFEVGGKDFMQWLVQKDKNIGRYNSILPLVQKPISKCTMLLPMQTKILICPVQIGISALAKRTTQQKFVLLFLMNH